MYKLILLHVTEPCLIRFGPELFQRGNRRMECKIFISDDGREMMKMPYIYF